MRKVSVIIPTYKRPTKLARAIDSVLNQLGNFCIEILVVDDNNDGDEYRILTQNLMQHYQSDNRIIYLRHKNNKNGSAARNTGIRIASGDYIAFLDDDDFFLPGRIAKALYSMEKENAYGACCGYLKNNGSFFYKISSTSFVVDDAYKLLSGSYDFAAGSTLLVKREVFETVGLFDEEFFKHQDWEFLIRYLRHYKLIVTSDVSIVICTDGFRNTISTDQIIKAKEMLFNKYSYDYSRFSMLQKKNINRCQVSEIVNSFLKEKRYRDLKKFSKSNVVQTFYLRNIPHYIFSLFQGYFPVLVNYVLFLLLDRKIRFKNNDFLNSIKI